MDALATTTELQARLEWTLSADEVKVATGALDDLSDDARDYGSQDWVDAETAPPQVVRLVLRAARRFMENYEGFVMSRSADETAQFPDRGDSAGSPEFSEKEIGRLRRLAGRDGLYSVELSAWDTQPHATRVGCVPSEGDDRPFPIFYDDENNLPPRPWWDEQPMLPYFGPD